MQTCETCRHWRPPGTLEAEGWGDDEFGCCWNQSDPRFEAELHEGPGILATRADFGCIAHEPRE